MRRRARASAPPARPPRTLPSCAPGRARQQGSAIVILGRVSRVATSLALSIGAALRSAACRSQQQRRHERAEQLGLSSRRPQAHRRHAAGGCRLICRPVGRALAHAGVRHGRSLAGTTSPASWRWQDRLTTTRGSCAPVRRVGAEVRPRVLVRNRPPVRREQLRQVHVECGAAVGAVGAERHHAQRRLRATFALLGRASVIW